MEVQKVIVGPIEVEVSFKPIKNLHLSVHPPDGRVTIASPDFHDLEKIKIYLATKLAWIKREQKKIQGQAREGEKLFITRESHQFLGKRYLLHVIEAKRPKIVLRHSELDLYAVEAATVEQKRKTLYNWYKRELEKVILKYLSVYLKLMDLKLDTFGIRKMKTKWGSCVTDNGMIWFNIELAKKPEACIEYIVVHELVHLIERHHNKNFVILMDRYLPNWRIQKKILNELPV
jgi:predicted metal-dependent hydrolase